MKKLAILLIAVILLQSVPVFGLELEATYTDDPMYQAQTVSDDSLLEEETITFDKYRPRALKEGETLKKGVDVSYYQNERAKDKKIDWEALKADDVDFVFIRVGYRGYGTGNLVEDPYYKDNIEGALAAGLIVGVYVYSQAITPEEGSEEAQFLLDRIGSYNIQLPLIMDYEYAGNGTGRLYEANLSKADATTICEAFFETANKAGYQAAVYANRNFLLNQLYPQYLSRVWLAHYIVETDYTGDYDFWQFTSSGSVDGIVGLTDLNFWFDDGTFLNGLPFCDVVYNEWYWEGIRYAYENDIITGVKYDAFQPGAETTRSQIITMLYRMAGSPAVKNPATFTDLVQDYYKDPIAWGQAEGITTGTPGNLFDPEGLITRQDMVTMLYRMSGEPKVTGGLSQFTDASKVSDYAFDAMVWAVDKGIVQGTSPTQLSPLGTTTRAEAATLLARFHQLT